jgi:uncharacterized protein YnzC (UPF0291/DUF896 family)
MEQKKMDRINELAKLKKERPLTEAELKEQAELRAEYIAEWRASTMAVLENTYVQQPDGTKVKLQKKQ